MFPRFHHIPELTTAMTERNLTKLDKVVSAIETSELKGKLHLQLAMAKRILEQLKRIEKLRYVSEQLDVESHLHLSIFVHH